MTDKVTCELFIAMNEDGGWVVVTDESEALAELARAEGGYHARVVKINVLLTPPVMIATAINVSDDAGETKEVEAAAV